MQYTTLSTYALAVATLFYQDFKDTFVCNTQHCLNISPYKLSCFIRISKILLYAIHNYVRCYISRRNVVLSGFQRYFCMQYTTEAAVDRYEDGLFYQDFKDTFVCNTQPCRKVFKHSARCFIRISKILLYAIHNFLQFSCCNDVVVLSGFQRYFCMQYTTP